MGEALFRDCLGEILDFIGSARVFIHNAAYDKRMIGFELAHAGQPHLMPRNISDTVTIAKKVWPGQKCGMDALMDRLMPGQRRGKHNALEDCRILSRLMPHFVPATDQEVDRLLNGGGRRLSASRQGWRQRTRQPAPAPAPAKPLKPVPAFGTGMKDGVAEAIARARTAQDAAALRTFGQDGWSGIARAQLLEVLAPRRDVDALIKQVSCLEERHADAALRWVCRGLSVELSVERERYFMEKTLEREAQEAPSMTL